MHPGSELRWTTKAFVMDASTAPGCCQNDFLMITRLMNTASGLTDPRMIAGDFRAPGELLSMLSTPNYLVHFLESIYHGSWTPNVIVPTGNCNALDLIYTTLLPHVQTSTEAS